MKRESPAIHPNHRPDAGPVFEFRLDLVGERRDGVPGDVRSNVLGLVRFSHGRYRIDSWNAERPSRGLAVPVARDSRKAERRSGESEDELSCYFDGFEQGFLRYVLVVERLQCRMGIGCVEIGALFPPEFAEEAI